jgi:hypothetical protein
VSPLDLAGEELRILTPCGMFGYGIPVEHFKRGMGRDPHIVIVDSGSTDPGPYQLGLGHTLVSRSAYMRELALLMDGCAEKGTRLVISSAGGAGTDAQLDDMIGMIREIARARGRRARIAAIRSSVAKDVVREGLRRGRVSSCGSAPELTETDIDETVDIVAQMGAEPFARALNEHPDADIIVTGRAYDPAPHAGFCMGRGIDPGLYWHMGKIIECGAACAEPKGRNILATIRPGSFDVEPMNPAERCTPTSVAAHTLYEKTRPDLLSGPGGTIDLRGARYEALDDRRVRVSGSAFIPSQGYTVKLEGAAIVGYRTIFIGGIRDPILLGQLDGFLAEARRRTEVLHPELARGEATLHYHCYGRDAVMGALEPLRDRVPHEIGLLGEITAPTQEMANAIAGAARVVVLHMPYPGQICTAGNFAIPLNPPENPIGPVCRFSIYHLLEVEDPTALFPIETIEV